MDKKDDNKVLVDEYYNNGMYELVRTGRHVILKNNMTNRYKNKKITKLKKRYVRLKKTISKEIGSVRKLIIKCDPIQLLTFCSDLFMADSLYALGEEKQAIHKNTLDLRMTEYIQSIIVSSPSLYKESKKDPRKIFFRIKGKLEKINQHIEEFYLCWGAKLEDFYPDYSEEDRRYIFEAQLLYLVRGNRYQHYEKEYYERLLKEHDEILIQLYGISYTNVIDGIQKIQYALSQGKADVIKDLGYLMEEFYESGETSIQEFRENHIEQSKDFADKFFGTKLRDVISITGWPKKMVQDLSWDVDECNDFFCEKDYSGWPIIDLPVQKRPFLCYRNRYYCFDYYSFVDNFYRSLQKAISRSETSYNWNEHQKKASEEMVADVFTQILPGCSVYRDNYYPKGKSTKQMSENDLLIRYGNIIIVGEVKAGSFVYTAPIIDFQNHITSYKTLIEEADGQCKRTYDYLKKVPEAIIYNEDKSEKVRIDMSEIQDIFMFNVTIDNINEFAARAEKMSFLKLQCPIISISIDELMVYRDYFDSPLVFLHFLQQRRQATQEKKIALNDELDHLGMYIEHNMYFLQLEDYPDDASIHFDGYREKLDEYFNSLYHLQLKVAKPVQDNPEKFNTIIEFLSTKNVINNIGMANYLLSFSSDAKNQLIESIEYALVRQPQIEGMISFGVAGNGEHTLRYTAFVEQPNIKTFTDSYKKDYVLSTMLWNEEENRTQLEFKFDKQGYLVDVNYLEYQSNIIKESLRNTLLLQGKARAEMRVRQFRTQCGIIQDEVFCPCGSGKEYGLCCKPKGL